MHVFLPGQHSHLHQCDPNSGSKAQIFSHGWEQWHWTFYVSYNLTDTTNWTGTWITLLRVASIFKRAQAMLVFVSVSDPPVNRKINQPINWFAETSTSILGEALSFHSWSNIQCSVGNTSVKELVSVRLWGSSQRIRAAANIIGMSVSAEWLVIVKAVLYTWIWLDATTHLVSIAADCETWKKQMSIN